MPKINAVSEGVWLVAFLCIISGLFGPGIWTASPLGFRNNKILLFIFLSSSLGSGYQHIIKILQKTDQTELLLKARLTLALMGITILIHLFRPSFNTYKYMYIMVLMVSKITILCQVAHITGRDFQPVRFTLLGAAFLLLLCLLFALFNSEVYPLRLLAFLGALAIFGNFVVIVALRMATMLGIRIFVVSPSGTGSSPSGGSVEIDISSPGTNTESQTFKKVENQSDTTPEVDI